jgi:hypothetical protein
MLFVAYDSKAKLALGVLGCGAFLVVGVFIWKQGSTDYRTFAAIDWLFFGCMLLLGLVRLLRRVPALIINHVGIFDNSSALGWLSVAPGRNRLLLCFLHEASKVHPVRIHDLKGVLSRQTMARAALMRMNIRLRVLPSHRNCCSTCEIRKIMADHLSEMPRQRDPT